MHKSRLGLHSVSTFLPDRRLAIGENVVARAVRRLTFEDEMPQISHPAGCRARVGQSPRHVVQFTRHAARPTYTSRNKHKDRSRLAPDPIKIHVQETNWPSLGTRLGALPSRVGSSPRRSWTRDCRKSSARRVATVGRVNGVPPSCPACLGDHRESVRTHQR